MNVLSTPRTGIDGAAAARGDAGMTLLDEAVQLIEDRRWRHALTVLDSIGRLRPNDPVVDELTVIAAAHAHRRKQLTAALNRIEGRETLTASAHHARSVAALARHRYADADASARLAIEANPDSAAGWVDLATAFAGQGWFDQATECLTTADTIGEIAPVQQWRLGRAVNHWALTRTPALAITAVATILVGLLALAVGLSTPMLLRELRVKSLPEPFKGAAGWHWETEHRIKVAFAFGVLVSVIGFVISVSAGAAAY